MGTAGGARGQEIWVNIPPHANRAMQAQAVEEAVRAVTNRELQSRAGYEGAIALEDVVARLKGPPGTRFEGEVFAGDRDELEEIASRPAGPITADELRRRVAYVEEEEKLRARPGDTEAAQRERLAIERQTRADNRLWPSQYPADTRETARELYIDGASIREIAERLPPSERTIARYTRDLRE